jgi:hypothetical protein
VRAEVSYDLVMDKDMAFVEGAYRLPDGGWEVVIVFHSRTVAEPCWRRSRWDSGVTGVVIDYPRIGY